MSKYGLVVFAVLMSWTVGAADAGLKLAGPLPGDLQNNIPYAAAATTASKAAGAAIAFISFVSSAKAKAEFVAAGGE